MMRAILLIVITLFLGQLTVQAQPKSKPKPKPRSVPAKTDGVPIKDEVRRGVVIGRTYRNESLGFELTFPDTWLIPGDDFEAEMKKAGFDLSLKAPLGLGADTRTNLNKALERVTIDITAYRSMPGSEDNAIVRISLEDLSKMPQIKDAVDYFDAIRAQYAVMRLPADFKYSDTQAEKLGNFSFGFMDSSSDAGKKRLYATVRKRHAVLISLSYSKDEDLETLRKVLSEADFNLNKTPETKK